MSTFYDKLYRKIGKIIYSHPRLRNYMPDKMYIQCRWRERRPESGEIDLMSPKTFNEKLNWLKLYYHNPLLHTLVDKYEVKKYVAERIGEKHIVKTLGIYDTVEEIDLNKLPNQFVLKCTHDSGSVVVCKDKNTFNFEDGLVELRRGLSITDYYHRNREWAYKGVKPRIIAEEYIDTLGKPESIEYKITCINGKVVMTTICSGIAHVEFEKRFNDHFDRNFNRLPFYASYKPAGKELVPSEDYDKMIEICEKLSKDIPQVRVDLYIHQGNIYFGEMTFYTWGGFIDFTPKSYDLEMGKLLELPKNKWK